MRALIERYHPKGRHSATASRRWEALLLVLGAAGGAAVAFLGDPRSGARRRATARDRTAGFARRGTRRGLRALRGLRARVIGWSRRARHRHGVPRDYDDATLADKVRTELFRPADAPKADVKVNVARGIVQLRGKVERQDLIDDLVAQVRRVQGVREVESLLHLPDAPAPMHR